MYQPVTGIGNGRGDILDGIQAGMNLKRNWLNRGIQKNINNDILQEREKIRALNPFGGNNNDGTQQQVVQQQVVPQQQNLITQQTPQQNVYSVGSPVVSVGEVPQQPGFGSVLKTDNPYPFGVSVNSETPSSTENNVSGVEQKIQPQVQVGIPQQISSFQQALQALPSAKYLGDEYRTDNYIKNLQGQGYGAVIGRLADLAFMNPLRESAKADRTQEAMRQYLTSTDPQVRQDAMTQLSIDYNNPTLADDIQHKKDAAQLARDRLLIEAGFMPQWMEGLTGGGTEGGENNAGNSVLNVLNGFKEGEQWMSPDGTGDSDTQCSNFVSHGLRKAGIDIKGSANGDELMKQFGERNAYHKGTLEGIQPGDVIDFPKHVAFYIGNGMYKARNSKGGVHTGTMEEAVSTFGKPIGYASVREYTAGGGNRWGALRLTPKEISRRNREERAERLALLKEQNAERRHQENLAMQKYKTDLRYGNRTGNGLSQKELKELNKAQEEMRENGYNLSKTELLFDEDVDGKKSHTKEYNGSMDKFVNNLGKIYNNEYEKFNLDNVSSLEIAVDFYDKINQNKLGITPETLTEAIAKTVGKKRGDITPEKLQEDLLSYIRQRKNFEDHQASLKNINNRKIADNYTQHRIGYVDNLMGEKPTLGAVTRDLNKFTQVFGSGS